MFKKESFRKLFTGSLTTFSVRCGFVKDCNGHDYTISATCLWCNGYRRRKWTRRLEFKSWRRLIAFPIALIPLGKV